MTMSILEGCLTMIKKVMPSKTMKGIKFYNVENLSDILDISKGAVRDYLRKEKISSVKVGQRFWVSEKNLSDFLLCATIRDLSDKKLVETVNKMVELLFNEYIDNHLIPCIKDVIRELKEKGQEVIPEKIANRLKRTAGIGKNLVKI
jgi:predicted transcriptional regulator